MISRNNQDSSTILYIIKDKNGTKIWRISPKGLLKLIRKEVESKAH